MEDAMATPSIAAHAARIAQAAPPLTSAQADRLASILRGTR